MQRSWLTWLDLRFFSQNPTRDVDIRLCRVTDVESIGLLTAGSTPAADDSASREMTHSGLFNVDYFRLIGRILSTAANLSTDLGKLFGPGVSGHDSIALAAAAVAAYTCYQLSWYRVTKHKVEIRVSVDSEVQSAHDQTISAGTWATSRSGPDQHLIVKLLRRLPAEIFF